MKKNLALVLLFLPFLCLATEPSREKIVSVVINVEGSYEEISSFSEFSHTVYEGRIKEDYKLQNQINNNALFIQVYNATNALVFEGYKSNPLKPLLEMFNADGTMTQINHERNKEAVMIRFYPIQATGVFTVKCSQVKNTEVRLISTFQIQL